MRGWRARQDEEETGGRNPERLKQAALEVDARSTAAFDANHQESLGGFVKDLPDPIDM